MPLSFGRYTVQAFLENTPLVIRPLLMNCLYCMFRLLINNLVYTACYFVPQGETLLLQQTLSLAMIQKPAECMKYVPLLPADPEKVGTSCA